MEAPALRVRACALAVAALVAMLFLGLRVALWLDVGGPGFEAFVLWRAGTGTMLVATLLCVARGAARARRARRVAAHRRGCGVLDRGRRDVGPRLEPRGDRAPRPQPRGRLLPSFYGLACAGVVLLLRDRMRPFRSSLALDGLVAGLTLAALSAALGLDVVLSLVESDSAAATVALAYPLADELMLCLVGLTFALTGWRPGASWAFLVAGLRGDERGRLGVRVRDREGHVGRGGPGRSPVAAVDADPGRGRLAARPPRPGRPTGRRLLAIPSAFALVAIGLLLYGQVAEVPIVAGALAALALLAGTVRARRALQENAELVRRFRAESLTDALTGLANRRRLMADLEQRLAAPGASRGLAAPVRPRRLQGLQRRLGPRRGGQAARAPRARARDVDRRRGARVPPRG